MKTTTKQLYGAKVTFPKSDFFTNNEFGSFDLCCAVLLSDNCTLKIAHELKPCDFKVSKQTYENRFLPVNKDHFSYCSYEKKPKTNL